MVFTISDGGRFILKLRRKSQTTDDSLVNTVSEVTAWKASVNR